MDKVEKSQISSDTKPPQKVVHFSLSHGKIQEIKKLRRGLILYWCSFVVQFKHAFEFDFTKLSNLSPDNKYS